MDRPTEADCERLRKAIDDAVAIAVEIDATLVAALLGQVQIAAGCVVEDDDPQG